MELFLRISKLGSNNNWAIIQCVKIVGFFWGGGALNISHAISSASLCLILGNWALIEITKDKNKTHRDLSNRQLFIIVIIYY